MVVIRAIRKGRCPNHRHNVLPNQPAKVAYDGEPNVSVNGIPRKLRLRFPMRSASVQLVT
jgi:hypothetical protein